MSDDELEPVEADPVPATASVAAEEIAVASDREGQQLISTQTVQHDYLTLNGQVARETITVDGTVTTVMDFIYDESGRPFALKYSDDGGKSFDTYYYVLNLQGDVVKLVWYIPGFEYKAVATYTYDAWGNVLTATGDMAEINPLRYRGYYFDSETGFYYLQSRYYDPVNHRFINADGYASTGQGFLGYNMFAYCENNPISNCDPSGNIPSDISSNAMLYGGGGRSTYLSKEERKLFAAIKKYNKYTINFCVGEIGNDPNRLNVTFYPDAGLIHIENSYLISDKYEKLAVISAIMSSEYYDKTLYGDSVDTMLIEWSGHNFVYRASTNSKLMYRFFQWRGYDNPIQSTQGVDFRKTLAPSAKRNYEFVTLWGWIQW